jgi:hypothetical protein
VFVLGNQANGYHRDLNRGFDRAGKRHLITWRDLNLLCWM